MNLSGGQIVLVNEILPNILADRQGLPAPIRQESQHRVDPKYPVGRGDKGESQLFLELSAEKRRNPRMGMDNVRLLLSNDLLQSNICSAHHLGRPGVRWNRKMPDSVFLQRLLIDAAIGRHQHLPPSLLQGQGQLHHMGFRTADFQAHENHEYFFHALTPLSPG